MKFRKKPVVIEAEQFLTHIQPWPAGVKITEAATGFAIFDSAQNGDVPVNPGDWIITGVQGERYPCKPDIFAATYEHVLEGTGSPEADSSNGSP